MSTSNEISIYQRMADPLAAVKLLGNAITKSQLFGCKNEAQGQVIAMECMASGLPPLSMARRFDLMNGKLAMKSQTMLADFRTTGGKTKLVEKSAERAAIDMIDKDGNKYEFELTWDDAKLEAFPYAGVVDGKDLLRKESDIVDAIAAGNFESLKLKPKYATPRSRAVMLWNRLISDSVRSIAPEINCGQYTPDEIEDFTAADSRVDHVELERLSQESEEEHAATQDAEFEVKAIESEAKAEPEPAETPETAKVAAADLISEETIAKVKTALSQANQLEPGTVGRVKKKLTAAGVTLAELSESDGQKLYMALEQKSLGIWFDAAIGGTEQDPN